MQPKADQVLLTSLEVPKDSNQDGGQGKEIETLKGKDKGQDKKKNSSNPTERASDTVISQPGQLLTQGSPRRKLRLGGFYYFHMFSVVLFVVSF